MRKKKNNQALIDFAAEAKARGMTYGKLQALETLAMLKRQEEKAKRQAQKGGTE